MLSSRRRLLARAVLVLALAAGSGLKVWSQTQQAASAGQPAKPVGTIKSISGNTIVLRLDAGTEVNVIVQGTPRVLRVAPGQTDLKSATPIQLQDLQVGDRVLVSGKVADDGKSVLAAAIVAMKAADVQAKQQKERAEWQRGAGGLVDTVDAGAGTISVSVTAPGGVRKVAIQTSKDTIFRRYAPNSVNFDDAKPSSLDQVKAGDQVRARGTRSPDGSSFAAAEIISGSFRNISGTINSIDAGANTMRVTDLAAKKSVNIKITADSQVKKLPPEIAQRIAMQLKMAKAGGGAQGSGDASQPAKAPGGAAEGGGEQQRGPGGGGRGGDLQAMLGRLPPSTLADFKSGDAVMIVATEGSASEATAITLLGGVEPILTAPGGGQGMTLSPWSMGGGEGDAAGQ